MTQKEFFESIMSGGTITDEMMEAKDKWKMARCERIEYLPAKSQILETLLFKIRSDRQST